MSHKILISGGTGLVGSRLTELLLKKGFEVSHIIRNPKTDGVPSFIWDIEKKVFDPTALAGVDTIVHLAGAGVADKRWTDERKKEILNSRIQSTALLYENLKKEKHNVKTVVAASATGYYGFVRGEIFNEESQSGTDFLAHVTMLWEKEVDKIASLGIRVVKLRLGIVLSERGGALVEIAKPVRYGFGVALGSGQQYLSWIHIDDLCEMFILAASDNKIRGTYNAVSPAWVTNREITREIARVLKKPLWLPAVPGFILKIIVGEMADIVLSGSKVSSEKIQAAGFSFRFPSLEEALNNLFQKS